jgi:hypothetical protein
MKRIILYLLYLSGISIFDAQLTTEKYALINGWYQYALSLQSPGNYRTITPDEIIPMPFVENRPEAVAQLDSLIADCRTEQKSLDGAMDSLKPDSGLASLLPDSLRRWMIYYLYSDQLKRIEKPVKIRYLCGKRDLYICNGSGTLSEGFLELSCLTGVCEGFEYGGPLIVSWAATEDTVMDSTRAVQMFDRARDQGQIVSSSTDPKWRPPSRVVRCAAPFYGRPAYHLVATVEYETEFRVRQATRETLTFYIFVLEKGGYEYLIAFHGAGGCFNVENLADFLSLKP